MRVSLLAVVCKQEKKYTDNIGTDNIHCALYFGLMLNAELYARKNFLVELTFMHCGAQLVHIPASVGSTALWGANVEMSELARPALLAGGRMGQVTLAWSLMGNLEKNRLESRMSPWQ